MLGGNGLNTGSLWMMRAEPWEGSCPLRSGEMLFPDTSQGLRESEGDLCGAAPGDARTSLGWDFGQAMPSLMHLTEPGGPSSPSTRWVGEPHHASATHTAATEARFARFEFSRALNQSCFLNKAREELALGEIPGSQPSRSSPGDQTADKSEQTVCPQPCGGDGASVPGCPASLALPPRLLLSQARCSLLQLQPLSTLQPADGKNPCVSPRMPRRCAEYLPNGVLEIDIVHGSRDARAAGVSLGWKGKTNCISNLHQRAEGARGTRAPLPQAGDTGDTQPASFYLLMPISGDKSGIWGFSSPSSVGLQMFEGLEGVLVFAFPP